MAGFIYLDTFLRHPLRYTLRTAPFAQDTLIHKAGHWQSIIVETRSEERVSCAKEAVLEGCLKGRLIK